ncbi:MAG TPA: WhiB family transcriptional regulator [Acidimicrobiales bacterium]|nr:WhiB family transcriptional regulator [Acidimicrobiales bacterium]
MFAEVRIEDEFTYTEERAIDLRTQAACNDGSGSLTELFFSEDLYDIARAKFICRSCTVREECFEGARERREPWGVWGGELFVNGKVIAQKRRRGRPPKSRPAETIVIDGVEVVVVPAIAG